MYLRLALALFILFAANAPAPADLAEDAATAVRGKSAEERAAAAARLRVAGPDGMAALMTRWADLAAVFRASPIGADLENEALRLCEAADQVGAQKEAARTGFYWFTDLDAALAEAKRSEKPILALCLLGQFDEDLCCANSRYFRLAVYPEPRVRQSMKEAFVLYWHSVRPAPKLTVDFGNGSRLEKTIKGNSLHCLISPDGNVLDVLPGLSNPPLFLEWLENSKALWGALSEAQPERRCDLLHEWHLRQVRRLDTEWEQKNAGELWEKSAGDTSQFAAALASDPDFFYELPPSIAATLDEPPISIPPGEREEDGLLAEGDVRRAFPVTPSEASTAKVEVIRNFIYPTEFDPPEIPQDFGERPAIDEVASPLGRANASGEHGEISLLDDLPFQFSPASATAKRFSQSMTADAIGNRLLLHRRIHLKWLKPDSAGFFQSPRPEENLRNAVRFTYLRLFKCPIDDPYLGLVRGDAITALPNAGAK